MAALQKEGRRLLGSFGNKTSPSVGGCSKLWVSVKTALELKEVRVGLPHVMNLLITGAVLASGSCRKEASESDLLRFGVPTFVFFVFCFCGFRQSSGRQFRV